mgnify:CR=1 FL=1
MDAVRSSMPLVVGLGFLIIGLKMAFTGSTGLMHGYHLVGVSLAGCGAGVVAVLWFQFVRPRSFRK